LRIGIVSKRFYIVLKGEFCITGIAPSCYETTDIIMNIGTVPSTNI
jgi:hypothetical protein